MSDHSLAQKVFKNVLYNSSSVFITNVVGILVTIYLARVLGPEMFGIYSLAIAIGFLLLRFADAGISPTLTRYIADAMKKKDYGLVRGYIKTLGKIRIFLSIIFSLLLFTLSDILSYQIFNKPSLALPLKIVAIFIIFQSLIRFVLSIFNAFNDFKANLIRSIVYEFTRFIFIVLFVSIGLAVVGALLGFVIASFLALITLTVLLLSRYRFILEKSKSIDWKRVLRFMSYIIVGNIASAIFTYTDSIMIGIFLPAKYVGFYRAAYNIVLAISGLISIPTVLFPVFVQLEKKDLKNAFNRAFKYASILAFPIVFGLILMSKPIILFVYGRKYLPTVDVLMILSFLILRSALGFWGVIFTAKEKPEYPVYITLIIMFVNIILNYLLILKLGIIGAGIATVISNIFGWTIMAYLSKKLFGILFKADYLLKPLIASLIMFIILSRFDLNTLINYCIATIVGIFVYLIVLILSKNLTKEDVEYLKAIFTKT